MSCGIYCIENKVNGKKYIGKSVDIQERWKSHKMQLRNGNHANLYLQRSWDKYGDDSFDFSIIEECLEEDLNKREKYWIEFCDSFNNGFNLTRGGDGGNTIAGYTEEELNEYKAKKRKIHQKTALKGEKSPRAKHTNSFVEKIINCLLSGMPNVDVAHMFDVPEKYVSSIKNHEDWKSLTEGIVFPENRKNTMVNLRGKEVVQYDIYGNYVDTYINARDAERQTGCSYKHISSVCKGKRRTCGGYIWRFASEVQESNSISEIANENMFVGIGNCKPIARISSNGDILKEFDSIAEAARFYNIPETGIANVCKHKIKQTHGMIFKFLTLEELNALD